MSDELMVEGAALAVELAGTTMDPEPAVELAVGTMIDPEPETMAEERIEE